MLLGHHPLKRSISFLFFAFLSIHVFANDPIWQSVERASLKSEHPNYLKPVKAQTYQLNVAALKAEFALSPKEKKGKIRNYGKVISLPLPDGSFQKFAFAEYDIMEAGLMSKWDLVLKTLLMFYG